MPRKKTARRFEPPIAVSREMVEHEARYIAKEVEDYLVLSLNDVRRFLTERLTAWRQANDVLEKQIALMPEREQIALQAMLVRDSYHLFELYLAHVQNRLASGDVPATLAPSMVEAQLPFSQWLFGNPD